MGFLKRLFSRRRNPPSDEVNLSSLIRTLMEASSLAEKRRFVEQHPVLLSDEVDAGLQAMIAALAEEPELATLLTAYCQLLRRCRAIGVDAAFRELRENAMAEAKPDLKSIIRDFLGAPRIKKLELLEQNPVLLSNEADTLLGLLLDKFRDDDEAIDLISENRELLRRCREIGVEAAVREKFGMDPQMVKMLAFALESAKEGRTLEEYTGTVHDQFPDMFGGTRGRLDYLRDELQQLTQPADMPRRIELCRNGLQLAGREEEPQIWIILQVELGNSLRQTPAGDHTENVEQALFHYQEALTIATRERFPELWAHTHNGLATGYMARIQGDRAENIEQAIHHRTLALEVLSRADHPHDWAILQSQSADSYLERVQGDRGENIEQAINCAGGALAVLDEAPPDVHWANVHVNQAQAYARRVQGDKAQNVELSIHHAKQALTVYDRSNHPHKWAMLQKHLAANYQSWQQGDRAGNLEQAIDHYEQALAVRTQSDSAEEWASVQLALLNTYTVRIRGDKAENLEEAIRHGQAALAVYTRADFPEAWANTQNDLGNAYAGRIRGERAENLEEAIGFYQQALLVRAHATAPELWAATQSNLANAYRLRIHGDRTDNLERAIHHQLQALEVLVQAENPQKWANSQSNLAGAYYYRILGDRVANQERAIHHYERALEVFTSADYPEFWAEVHSSLGGCYLARERGERAENVERAIYYLQQALTILTRDAFPEKWARCHVNLANVYFRRDQGGVEENLKQSIHHAAQAETVFTRNAFPEGWAVVQGLFGAAYAYLIGNGNPVEENLERALHHHRQALTVYSRAAFPQEWALTQNALLSIYGIRARRGQREDIEAALQHGQAALEVYTLEANPVEHRRVQCNLLRICMQHGRWSEAVQAGQGALAAGNFLYTLAATPEARRAELAWTPELPASVAFALIALEDSEENRREAVLTLEHNRARWLAESLSLGTARPEAVPDDVWGQFTEATAAFRALQAESQLPDDTPAKRDFLTLSNLLAAARRAIEQATEDVRRHAPDFMPRATFADVQQALVGTGAVPQAGVYLASSAAGGVALIVHAGGVEAIPLDGLTENAVDNLLEGWLSAYRASVQEQTETAGKAWLDQLEAVTHELWEIAMGQLTYALDELNFGLENSRFNPHVTLIPTGKLALLPLHAAWKWHSATSTGRLYFLDLFPVHYAPSATALARARASASHAGDARLLAVDEPRPVTRGAPLPNASAEVDAIADSFAEPHFLRHEAAQEQTLLAAIPEADVVHFACHGTNDWDNPLNSGLLLAQDELLTVRDLLGLRLSAKRLVSLSACETGIVDTELPDEALMLPSALLQAGYGGVVASLWSVADVSSAMLMARFYVAWREEKLEPAEALRAAQCWLRDTSNAEKAAYFRKDIFTRRSGTRLPSTVAKDFFKQLLEKTERDALDFAHPFWWAAFTFSGV